MITTPNPPNNPDPPCESTTENNPQRPGPRTETALTRRVPKLLYSTRSNREIHPQRAITKRGIQQNTCNLY